MTVWTDAEWRIVNEAIGLLDSVKIKQILVASDIQIEMQVPDINTVVDGAFLAQGTVGEEYVDVTFDAMLFREALARAMRE